MSKSSSTPLTPSTAVAFHALSPRPGGTARGGRRPPPPRTAPLVSPARGKLRAARGMARAVRRTGPSAGP
ncbi:hypothetical protein SFR_6599 [Streptomyces sp. FR-008]|nr:hypothetical protein SFR_6599 [Streptomyces sp. FR-008]